MLYSPLQNKKKIMPSENLNPTTTNPRTSLSQIGMLREEKYNVLFSNLEHFSATLPRKLHNIEQIRNLSIDFSKLQKLPEVEKEKIKTQYIDIIENHNNHFHDNAMGKVATAVPLVLVGVAGSVLLMSAFALPAIALAGGIALIASATILTISQIHNNAFDLSGNKAGREKIAELLKGSEDMLKAFENSGALTNEHPISAKQVQEMQAEIERLKVISRDALAALEEENNVSNVAIADQEGYRDGSFSAAKNNTNTGKMLGSDVDNTLPIANNKNNITH